MDYSNCSRQKPGSLTVFDDYNKAKAVTERHSYLISRLDNCIHFLQEEFNLSSGMQKVLVRRFGSNE